MSASSTRRARWADYFISIARQVASRSTCDRAHVGCVITRDRTILATGYNGSIRGAPHCDDVGHMMEEGHCITTVHAEANAVVQAAKNGTRIEGAVVYVTHFPCWPCFKLLANAGVCAVVFDAQYRADARVLDHADAFGPRIWHVSEAPDELVWALS